MRYYSFKRFNYFCMDKQFQVIGNISDLNITMVVRSEFLRHGIKGFVISTNHLLN